MGCHFLLQVIFPTQESNPCLLWLLPIPRPLHIQKTKIMAFGPITSWQIDGETGETVTDFIWGAPKSLHPKPVLLPGKSHGWKNVVGCSPWGCEESDMTERLHFHFPLSCIGEGNGNPLQCSSWRIPWTEELDGLQSMGSRRVEHN